jgi:hypothetical protein
LRQELDPHAVQSIIESGLDDGVYGDVPFSFRFPPWAEKQKPGEGGAPEILLIASEI